MEALSLLPRVVVVGIVELRDVGAASCSYTVPFISQTPKFELQQFVFLRPQQRLPSAQIDISVSVSDAFRRPS